MIYAKCIRQEQIAIDKDEFIKRKGEEHNVYCVGETTEDKNGLDTLYCVPLNFIYDCLKHGNYIAIIDIDNDDEYLDGYYNRYQKVSNKQRVKKIFNIYSKEAIDYVFDNVGNPNIVHDGYVHWLSEELQAYFYKRKGVIGKVNININDSKDLYKELFNKNKEYFIKFVEEKINDAINNKKANCCISISDIFLISDKLAFYKYNITAYDKYRIFELLADEIKNHYKIFKLKNEIYIRIETSLIAYIQFWIKYIWLDRR